MCYDLPTEIAVNENILDAKEEEKEEIQKCIDTYGGAVHWTDGCNMFGCVAGDAKLPGEYG
ncbi:hypothetical protein H4219_006207, partial [Mycoemilia scoparia]